MNDQIDPMTGPALRRVAWHEAGHAIVAWDRSFTVTRVSIRRIGDAYGRCDFTPVINCAIPSERERGNIVAMAGWAAEHASGEAGNRTYDSADLSWVSNGINQHAPSRVAIELGWAEREAERIVAANLDRVERLAIELIHRVELTDAAEILKLIEGPQA